MRPAEPRGGVGCKFGREVVAKFLGSPKVGMSGSPGARFFVHSKILLVRVRKSGSPEVGKPDYRFISVLFST